MVYFKRAEFWHRTGCIGTTRNDSWSRSCEIRCTLRGICIPIAHATGFSIRACRFSFRRPHRVFPEGEPSTRRIARSSSGHAARGGGFSSGLRPSGQTIVKPTALGPVANTDTKLLIYGLFQKGRVLAQDGILRDPPWCPITQTNSRLLRHLGPISNIDTKLRIYGLFQKSRVLAQDGRSPAPSASRIPLPIKSTANRRTIFTLVQVDLTH